MPAAISTIQAASAAPDPADSARALTMPAARPGRPQTTVLDGQRLREARRQRGLSQERLAHQAGLSPATVARLERQRRPCCRHRTLARLAAALDLDPAAITPVLGVAPAPAAPSPRPAAAAPDSVPTGPVEMTGCLLTCARLSAEFGSHHIRADHSHYRRRPRYIATARQFGTRPYAIVTADPAELRAELIAAQPSGRRPARSS
jgi:transcriptional regulator with XRE-family HTH domain